jgi:hypothetical protein
MSTDTITLKHRIPWTLSEKDTLGNLTDTVGPSIKRAQAIADLLEIAAEVDGGSCLHGELLRCAGQAIRLELEDATALLNCYIEREASVRRCKQS